MSRSRCKVQDKSLNEENIKDKIRVEFFWVPLKIGPP